MNYFNLPYVSNSNLTEIKNMLSGSDPIDATEAFELGTLLDCMITEPERIDWFRKTLDGVEMKQWNMAYNMYKSFKNSPYNSLLKGCEFQKISLKEEKQIVWNGLEFSLPVRCKWDFYSHIFSGDIKTTTATSQKQFEAACTYFDYWRSRAWYMDIENTNRDILIGISKVTYKVFIVKIDRDDDRYRLGKEQYTELAMKWWLINN